MRILITGAGGMLGHDVRRAALQDGHDTVSLTRAQLDVTDRAAVADAVGGAGADVVINCAAWTNVDGAESESDQASAVNGDGAGHVAATAAAAGAWVIHVSTDYVFDGSKSSAYVESDPVGPISAYGRSKLAGERAVTEAAPDRHTIVRTAWLFGAGGRCFPKTILRAASARAELAVVADQVGCPTFTGHLADALLELIDAQALPLGVVHMAAAGSCSWYELAREVLASSGSRCELLPGDTADLGRPARRPACATPVARTCSRSWSSPSSSRRYRSGVARPPSRSVCSPSPRCCTGPE